MNNDLISRSKLIEIISQAQKKFPLDDRNPRAIGNRQCLFWIRNEVKNQPTAYDVDKVISEIDRCSIDNTDWKYSGHPKLASYYLSRTADVVEIVKRGGIDEI